MVFFVLGFIIYAVISWIRVVMRVSNRTVYGEIKYSFLNFVFIIFYLTFQECSVFCGLQLQNFYFGSLAALIGWGLLVLYILISLYIIYKIIVILNTNTMDSEARDKYLFLYAFEDTIDYKIKILNDKLIEKKLDEPDALKLTPRQ